MLSHFHLYGHDPCTFLQWKLRFPGVMGRRNGPSGPREDDDDDVCVFCEVVLRNYSVFVLCYKAGDDVAYLLVFMRSGSGNLCPAIRRIVLASDAIDGRSA